jgi:hypothetical protein
MQEYLNNWRLLNESLTMPATSARFLAKFCYALIGDPQIRRLLAFFALDGFHVYVDRFTQIEHFDPAHPYFQYRDVMQQCFGGRELSMELYWSIRLFERLARDFVRLIRFISVHHGLFSVEHRTVSHSFAALDLARRFVYDLPRGLPVTLRLLTGVQGESCLRRSAANTLAESVLEMRLIDLANDLHGTIVKEFQLVNADCCRIKNNLSPPSGVWKGRSGYWRKSNSTAWNGAMCIPQKCVRPVGRVHLDLVLGGFVFHASLDGDAILENSVFESGEAARAVKEPLLGRAAAWSISVA